MRRSHSSSKSWPMVCFLGDKMTPIIAENQDRRSSLTNDSEPLPCEFFDFMQDLVCVHTLRSYRKVLRAPAKKLRCGHGSGRRQQPRSNPVVCYESRSSG